MQYFYVEILGSLFMDLVMFFSRRNPDRPQPLPLSQPAPVSEARANCGPRNVLFLYRDESEKNTKPSTNLKMRYSKIIHRNFLPLGSDLWGCYNLISYIDPYVKSLEPIQTDLKFWKANFPHLHCIPHLQKCQPCLGLSRTKNVKMFKGIGILQLHQGSTSETCSTSASCSGFT